MNETAGGSRCSACRDGVDKPFPFSMAFQPIVDVETGRVYAYEALVRGMNGESASSILSQVTDVNRYSFDQNCRIAAIELASRLGLAETGARLSINFMPGAVYSPAACIQLTLATARKCRFPVEMLIFEITETEKVRDRAHLRGIVDEYRRQGFKVAIDDFGSGYSELNLVADVPSDYLKLDLDLVRDLHKRPAALTIVKWIVELTRRLGQDIVAEGVETFEEYVALRESGIRLMQGFLFAKPAFESLPAISLPQTPHSLSQPIEEAA